MKDKYKAIEGPAETDILCDNPECDFRFKHVPNKSMLDFVNMPCPECSENLLTPEDYKHFVGLQKVINWINVLLWPYMFLIGGRKPSNEAKVGYHHHAGKTTITREHEQGTT